MREQPLLRRVLLRCSHGTCRLFRMNVGMGWIGATMKVSKLTQVTLRPGDVVIRHARPIKFGFKGMHDLVGWNSVVITPEHVGKTLAVYTSMELKGTGGRVTEEQESFTQMVHNAGGIAGIVRTEDDAVDLLT